MSSNEQRDPESFVTDHFDRKKQRQQKRKVDRRQSDGGKRISRVGRKEKWHWDRNAAYDEE